jgi:hypothetical protein
MSLPPALRVILGVASALLLSVTVSAHHSFGMFDTTRRTTLDGVVKEFKMMNPHSFVVLEAKGADGKNAEWWIEAHSLLVLKRQGWTRHSMKAGDKVHLTINPLRTTQPGGYMLEATVNGALVGQKAPPLTATPQ